MVRFSGSVSFVRLPAASYSLSVLLPSGSTTSVTCSRALRLYLVVCLLPSV